ncbi:MAG: NAD-dependent deacetylase [Candidatus Hodarchaeota archaeon]
MELEEAIETTAQWIVDAKYVVVFTGAGISTASGLSDFRGPDGVWTRRDKGLAPLPSKIPRDQMKPNEGHYAIVELENLGKVEFLISQNVDGFHLDSGFPQEKLAELHGNTNYMVCLECNWKYRHAEIGWDKRKHGSGYRTSKPRENQPRCPKCGGRIISSIVNFGDPLPDYDLEQSIKHSRKCDLFIVLGSSLVVTPAANMVDYAVQAGAKLVINNKGDTPYDRMADILLPVNINDFFPPVVTKVRELLR